MTDSAFTQEQFEAIYPRGIENHYWNHARNRILRTFLVKHGLTNERILEIGCGKGIVVEFLRKQNIDCYGVELSNVKPIPEAKEYILTNTNAFSLQQYFTKGIKTIMLLDVIEHIEDPVSFIDSILNSFPNASHIVVTVPARQELWTNYDVFNGHFRRYVLNDITDMRNQRLEVKDSGYFNHVLYPVFLLFAKIVKNRSTVIHAPSGISVFLHRMLSRILQLDTMLVPKKIPGTSIMALFSIRSK
jgi:hypothetical protein